MSQQRLGPTINNYSYNLPKSLAQFIQDCNVYVERLDLFHRYLVWRYTIGSASVNSQLIFNQISQNAPRWAYLFFRYWKNTSSTPTKGIPKQFTKFVKYFADPDSFIKLHSSSQTLLAGELIKKYQVALQAIIKKAPAVKGEGFYVFKISARYPGLPEGVDQTPVDIVQQPFNSTTVEPYFNFAIFTSPTATCCLWKIFVPAGSKCLWIPTDLHAYNFEKEIVLPVGAIFKIVDIKQTILDYIDPATMQVIQVQKPSEIMMGNVNVLNEYSFCKGGRCVIQEKEYTTYQAVLVSK